MVFQDFLDFLVFLETSEVAGPGPNPREIDISFGADGPLACVRGPWARQEPTTNRLAKHQLIADVEVAEVVYSAQGRLAAAPEGRRLEDTSSQHKQTHRVAHRSSRSSGPGGHKQEARLSCRAGVAAAAINLPLIRRVSRARKGPSS